MQNELDIIRDVSARWDGADIAYMVTGSMAANYYAQPRVPADIDVVLALRPADAARLVSLLEQDFNISLEAVESAIEYQSEFILLHHESAIKVDCFIRKENGFRLAEFNRRQRIKIDTFELWMVSKEDLILSSLLGAKETQAEQPLRDAKNLVATGCNRTYIEQWIRKLEVEKLWQEL